MIDVFDLRSDGGKIVPVQVVETDHEGQEYQQECHHELHHILKHTNIDKSVKIAQLGRDPVRCTSLRVRLY